MYHLLFFSIPAFLHVQNNIFPFFSMGYEFELIAKCAQLSLTFILLFIFGYFGYGGIEINIFSKYVEQDTVEPKSTVYSQKRIATVVMIFILIQMAAILFYGTDAFIFRRDREGELIDVFGDNSYVQVFILAGIRGISFISLLIAYFIYKGDNTLRAVLVLISILVFLIINYPLAISRTQFFSYILAFIALRFEINRRTKLYLLTAFVLGVGTLFPYLSHMARGEGGYTFDLVEYYSKSGDFDGFQSFLNVVYMTDWQSISYGKQLIGAIFAFVPRIFWVDKPEPTGPDAAEFGGYLYTNVSSPIISEIYANFGSIGVALGGVVLGVMLRRLDISVSQYKREEATDRLAYIAVLLSFCIILFRGSLMAVVPPLYIELFLILLVFAYARLSQQDLHPRFDK